MIFALSSFKTKLFKHWQLVTKLIIPIPLQNKYAEVWLGHFCPWLNNIGQGGTRGEVIGVPNLSNRHSVGKKLQNSKHFLSKIEGRVHSNNAGIQMYHLKWPTLFFS